MIERTNAMTKTVQIRDMETGKKKTTSEIDSLVGIVIYIVSGTPVSRLA